MQKNIKPIEISKANFAKYGDLISTNNINPIDIYIQVYIKYRF